MNTLSVEPLKIPANFKDVLEFVDLVWFTWQHRNSKMKPWRVFLPTFSISTTDVNDIIF